MTNITYEEAVEAVEKIVEEYGYDHEYDAYEGEHPREHARYRYTNIDGSPSCIVGCLLNVKLPDTFAEIHAAEFSDGEQPRHLVGTISGLLRGNWVTYGGKYDHKPEHELTTSFDGKAKSFLYALQDYQDQNFTWGKSLELAKAYAEEYGVERG